MSDFTGGGYIPAPAVPVTVEPDECFMAWCDDVFTCFRQHRHGADGRRMFRQVGTHAQTLNWLRWLGGQND